MPLPFFESRERSHADHRELMHLHNRFGDELATELRRRIAAPGLRMRDRQHWKRILRKARNSGIA